MTTPWVPAANGIFDDEGRATRKSVPSEPEEKASTESLPRDDAERQLWTAPTDS